MPDAQGRFKGILVPELPWLKKSLAKDAPPVPKDGLAIRDKRATLT